MTAVLAQITAKRYMLCMTVTAALIIIGNEILSGRTQDKNLAVIAVRLNGAGVRLTEVRVIPDVEDTIIATVTTCRAAFDYVFTTGGIGPTHDDITSQCVAAAFGVPLIRHLEAVAALTEHYKERGDLNEARLKMADVPEGATLVPNPVSAAPGYQIGNVFVMAGVPRIMEAMLSHILPQLKGDKPMQSVNLTTNIPEGTLADGLTEIQNRYKDVEIGSYPKFANGELSTTLVFSSVDDARNTAALAEAKALIAQLGGSIF
jgi:molybdenum cofactor synthesis domain-containing protein